MKTVSAAQLLGADAGAVEWIVEGLIPARSMTMLCSPPKSSKSFLSILVSQCVSTGAPLLGKFHVPAARVVLYVSEEDSAAIVASRFKALQAGHGLPTPPPGQLHFAIHTGVRLDEAESVEKLTRKISEIRPALVVFDTLNRFSRLNDNSQKAATYLMGVFESIRRTGPACLILAHTTKGAEGKSGGTKIRGSGVFHSWLDAGFYLAKRANRVAVEIESKFAAVEPFVYEFREENGGIRLAIVEAASSSEPFITQRARRLERERRKKRARVGGR